MQEWKEEALAALQAMMPEARMMSLDYLKEMARMYPAPKSAPLRLVSGGENVYAFRARRFLRGDLD